MKKSELRKGDKTTFRDGKTRTVDYVDGDNIWNSNGYHYARFNEDLTCTENEEYDIVKVVRPE